QLLPGWPRSTECESPDRRTWQDIADTMAPAAGASARCRHALHDWLSPRQEPSRRSLASWNCLTKLGAIHSRSYMDRFTEEGGTGRFANGFGERRVSVNNPCDILGRTDEFDCGHGFGNHVAGTRSKDMDAQQTIGLCIRQHLDQTFGLIET